MAEELQQLLNRINEECLKKADAEQAERIAAAKAEAARIVAEAEASAKACREAAEQAAAGFQRRAEAAARQAARDIVLALRGELEARLDRAIGRAAATALTPDFMAGLIKEMAASVAAGGQGDVQVLSGERDAAALTEALRGTLRESFGADGRVFPTSGIRSGMQVSFNGADVFYDFSDAAVRELLRGYLGAELAKLLDGATE